MYCRKFEQKVFRTFAIETFFLKISQESGKSQLKVTNNVCVMVKACGHNRTILIL